MEYDAKYTYPPSSIYLLDYIEVDSSYIFPGSILFDLQYFFIWIDVSHLQHLILDIPRDLNLSMELDLLLDLDISLSFPCPFTISASFDVPYMAFLLISSNKRASTTSSLGILDEYALPITTTKLSYEFGREYSKVMHLSSSSILNLRY